MNETDEEYAAKLQDWESKAQSVKMQMTIDAKLSKPDLEKFKTELVLPNIERKNQRNDEPSPELLEQAQKARDKFLSKLNSDYTNFKGYETKHTGLRLLIIENSAVNLHCKKSKTVVQ